VLHESTSSAANIAAIAALKVQSTDDDFDNPPESEPNKTPTNPQTDPTKTPNTQSGAIKVTQPSTHDKVSTHLRSNSITLSPGSFNSGHSATNNTQTPDQTSQKPTPVLHLRRLPPTTTTIQLQRIQQQKNPAPCDGSGIPTLALPFLFVR
jgi:hypothetical protein